jgi:DNA-binding MarR family transcriptional regulator
MQDRALWDKEEDDMSETVLASPRKSDLLEIVKTLSDVTRKLSEITRALAAQAGESPPAVEALAESEAALAQASRHLSMLQEEETHQQEREEARRKLRKDILVELSRRGRAFPLELAAAILTFVEDIEPVLRELEKEGLVRIRRVAGTEVIELTPMGRDAARHLNGL